MGNFLEMCSEEAI